MKKSLLSVASVALVLAAVNAQAESVNNPGGNISFLGSLVASTCVIDSGDQSKSVTLGQYATSIFKNIGDQTPDVPFTIRLTGCAKAANNYGLRFEGTTVNSSPNLLALKSTSDLGVGIEILGAGDKVINLNQPADDTTWQAAQAAGATDITTFNLKAHYKSFAQKVSSGDAASNVKFVIAYK
ncbi:fimbrial protein [Erwinia tasmaniensis]|uniref:Fimbrial protein n=1 Tax=Erwinia tasmaniensis (strain DSM 17950 / CFBP 7177 / CIP 109463 / NCPPB 4357 / Et1/99) TaxID=465817 RepID=B2VH39_ERWT9|nr:fimbrial protein [Erwinia tasmaniensis]CAO95703.1 fimbrial protein [Erwinia tasmaniensis Et1/99]